MPELPEVETIMRNLVRADAEKPSVIGQVIESVQVYWAKTVQEPDGKSFIETLPGMAIKGMQRRGKFLQFDLDEGHLLIHLRMSGDLYLVQEDLQALPDPHDRLHIRFKSGWRLVFNDTRKFGRVWYVSDPQKVYARLGPEPLSTALSGERFYAMLQACKRQIKPLLMDQGFLSGIGNIYADEALFLAQVHPNEISSNLSQAQASVLLNSIRSVLEEGIRRNGASIDWVYRGGDFQNYFNVYQRAGEPCKVCGTVIEKKLVGQRGTHYCPNCQALIEEQGA